MDRKQTLDKAATMICGGRDQDYGKPENNFTMIANLWSAYLSRKVSPNDVAMMMALLKIARIKANPEHTDSFVDAVGYIACGADISTESKKPAVDNWSRIDSDVVLSHK